MQKYKKYIKKNPQNLALYYIYIYNFFKIYCNYIVINLLKFSHCRNKVLDFGLRKLNFKFFSTDEKKKIKMHENA